MHEKNRMRRTLQGCVGPTGGSFRTWPWIAQKADSQAPIPVPYQKIIRLRVVATRINSFINAAHEFNVGGARGSHSGLECPSWKWYKPLADWFQDWPLDNFHGCPDPKVYVFDGVLDRLSFPKAPNKEDYMAKKAAASVASSYQR